MNLLRDRIHLKFGGRRVTARAGHMLLQLLMDRLRLLQQALRELPGPGSNPGYGVDVIINAFMHLLYGGEHRLADVRELRADGLFQKTPLPSDHALGDWLRRAGRKARQGLARLNRTVLQHLVPPGVYTLDIDETMIVSSRPGSRRAYNGKRGFMASAAFLAETGAMVANAVHPGSFRPGTRPHKLLRQARPNMPCGARIGLVRSDSAGYSAQLVGWCRRHGARFVVAARRTPAAVAGVASVAEEDWQRFTDTDGMVRWYAEISHSIAGRPPCRLIYICKRKKPKPGEELDLNAPRFVIDRTYVTDLPDAPLAIEAQYRRRGKAENRIKEWKSGAAARFLPCSGLAANRAYARLCRLAYNLHLVLANTLFPGERPQMRTMRWRVLQLGATITHHAHLWLLNIADRGSYVRRRRWRASPTPDRSPHPQPRRPADRTGRDTARRRIWMMAKFHRFRCSECPDP